MFIYCNKTAPKLDAVNVQDAECLKIAFVLACFLRLGSDTKVINAYFSQYVQVILKLGPRYELGDQSPREEDGWKLAASGNNYAVWEKNN